MFYQKNVIPSSLHLTLPRNPPMKIRSLSSGLLLAVIALSTPLQAQSADALRAKFMLPVPEIGLGTEQGRFPRGAPGTSSGSPIAFGANWNDAFVGFGAQSAVRYSAAGDADGSASMGFGLGNSSKSVGLEVALNALSSIRSGVGNRMGLSFKAHKILPNNWGAALGYQGVQLGTASDDKASIYGVVTHVWQLDGTPLKAFQSLTWSGGVGTGAFQSASDLNSGKDGMGVFSSVALRTSDRMSVIADWSGQDLNLGLSFVPFKDLPLVLSPAIADITGASNNGLVEKAGSIKKTGMRFTLGVGFAFRLNPIAPAPVAGPAAQIVPTGLSAEQLAAQAATQAAAEAAAKAEDERRTMVAAREAEAKRVAEATARAAAEKKTADSIATVRRAEAEAAAAALEAERRAKAAAVAVVRNALTAPIAATAVFSAEQKAMLNAKVDIMKANAAVKIRIAGNTDERGAAATNMKLGLTRANVVKQYLVSKGVAAARIETISYGKTRPIDPAHTAAAWAKNRRVEFEVTAGGDDLVAAPAAPAPAAKPVAKPAAKKPAAKPAAPAAKAPAAKAPAAKAPAAKAPAAAAPAAKAPAAKAPVATKKP